MTECPNRIVTPDVVELTDLYAAWQKGMPPSTSHGGGVLDQTESFLQAVAFYAHDLNEREQARMSRDGD